MAAARVSWGPWGHSHPDQCLPPGPGSGEGSRRAERRLGGSPPCRADWRFPGPAHSPGVCLSSEEGRLGTTGPEEIRKTRPLVQLLPRWPRASGRLLRATHNTGRFAHSPRCSPVQSSLVCPWATSPALTKLREHQAGVAGPLLEQGGRRGTSSSEEAQVACLGDRSVQKDPAVADEGTELNATSIPLTITSTLLLFFEARNSCPPSCIKKQAQRD